MACRVLKTATSSPGSPRYDYNEITVEYAGNTSGTARVDSLKLDDNGNLVEIISRKNTQLADVQIDTARGYLRELAQKFPEGAMMPDTPKNTELGLNGLRLEGRQILEVPAQNGAIPQAILDYADDLNIVIRDIEGGVYR